LALLQHPPQFNPRVVKKLMRPPDDNIAEVRLSVLDYELSGYCTDPGLWRGWETTGYFPYPGDYVPHCNAPNIEVWPRFM